MSKTLNIQQPPATAFISTHTPPAPPPTNVPAGYILQQENKSKRLNLLLRPNTFKQISELAECSGKRSGTKISVNEAINRILEKAVSDPEALIQLLSEHG